MSKQAKTAIIGAGLAGLACAYFLQERTTVTLYDSKGIGGGSSGVAAGLLHPYGGKRARLNWRGKEGMQASLKLIETVAPDSITLRGIRRIPVHEEQKEHFIASAKLYKDLEWRENYLWIAEGVGVDIPSYLHALWDQTDAELVNKKVTNLDELKDYNQIVLAAGSGIFSFPEASELPLRKLKGQLLNIRLPKEAPLPQQILTGKVYIVPNPQDHTCIVGATFEREFNTEEPNRSFAERELLKDAYTLWPPLKGGTILSCEAGIRVTSRHHKPLSIRLNEKVFVITALGSKGLLYHALIAQEMAQTFC